MLLEIETALAPGRDMLRGIAKFVREIHRWEIHSDAGHWSLNGAVAGPSHIEQLPPGRVIDGTITRIYDEASERAALQSIEKGIPVIDILGDYEVSSVPLVHCDDSAIARLALDHLRQQGFRRFAF